MIYIAICDDDEKTIVKLKKSVQVLLKENNIVAKISEYSQSQLLQYDVQEGKYFDLILSDIEMPQIDGMKLVKYIKKYLPDVFIIFVTSHTKYAIDAYELSVFRYIPKNMFSKKFEHAILDAIKMINGKSNQVYSIDMPTRVEKIPYDKILYMEREGKNTIIILNDGSKTHVRKSLATVAKELNSEEFVYVDRGNIANVRNIVKIKDDSVELENGVRLLASHSRIEEVKNRLNEFWGERI